MRREFEVRKEQDLQQLYNEIGQNYLIEKIFRLNREMPPPIIIKGNVIDRVYAQLEALVSSLNSTEPLP